MLYRIRNGFVAIPDAAYLETVPICTMRFETRHVQKTADSVQYTAHTVRPSFQVQSGRGTLPVDIWQVSPDSFKTHLNSFRFI